MSKIEVLGNSIEKVYNLPYQFLKMTTTSLPVRTLSCEGMVPHPAGTLGTQETVPHLWDKMKNIPRTGYACRGSHGLAKGP